MLNIEIMKKRVIIGGILVTLALIVVCSGAGMTAIRRSGVALPQFVIDLGPVQALGRLSTIPVCSYATSCLLDPSGRDVAIYTIWIIQRPALPGAPSRAIRLASLVIDDGS